MTMTPDNDDNQQRLDALDAKLKAHKRGKPTLHDETAAERAERQNSVMKAGASAGLEFAAAILFSTAFGVFLDKKLDTMPIFLFTFMFAGMIVAFYNLYRASENLSVKKDVSQLPSGEEDAKKTSVLEESNHKD